LWLSHAWVLLTAPQVQLGMFPCSVFPVSGWLDLEVLLGRFDPQKCVAIFVLGMYL
jgi:hypothetical protein